MNIQKKDWGIISDLVGEIAAYECSGEIQQAQKSRKKILEFIDRLEIKYGDNVNLLATKADCLLEPKERLNAFKKAYKLARSNEDTWNEFQIIDSLIQEFISFADLKQAQLWMNKLLKFKDIIETSEFEHLCKERRKDLEKLNADTIVTTKSSS